jgi:hypothetical protein
MQWFSGLVALSIEPFQIFVVWQPKVEWYGRVSCLLHNSVAHRTDFKIVPGMHNSKGIISLNIILCP